MADLVCMRLKRHKTTLHGPDGGEGGCLPFCTRWFREACVAAPLVAVLLYISSHGHPTILHLPWEGGALLIMSNVRFVCAQDLDMRLKAACEAYMRDATAALLGPIPAFMEKVCLSVCVSGCAGVRRLLVRVVWPKVRVHHDRLQHSVCLGFVSFGAVAQFRGAQHPFFLIKSFETI